MSERGEDAVTVTWWGHATCSVRLGGVHVLTDPVLTDRVAHLRRYEVPAPPQWITDADVVVISHLHADHLHPPSLRMLSTRTRLIAPHGTAALFARQAPEIAARIEGVRPGDTVRVGAVRIRATSAEHDGRRFPWSRFHGPALGFVLDAGGERVWFAGDTGLFEGMRDIGPVDIAIVPVGGWGPTLGPHHLDPVQAAEAVRRVGARVAVPIHYGTFWPTGLRTMSRRRYETKFRRPGELFAAALTASTSPAHAHVVRPGTPVGTSVR